MTDEYFLSLNKICNITVSINTSTIKASSRHELTPTTDDTIVEGEVVIFAIQFLNMSLNNRYPPTGSKSIVCKHHQHLLVPEIFAFSVAFLKHFVIGKGEIQFVTKIKIIIYYAFCHLLQNFIILRLVYGVIQQLVLKRNKTYTSYAQNLFHIQSGSCLSRIYYTEISLLVHNHHSHHQEQVFFNFFIHVYQLFFESVGADHRNFGCDSIDLKTVSLGECGLFSFELSNQCNTIKQVSVEYNTQGRSCCMCSMRI